MVVDPEQVSRSRRDLGRTLAALRRAAGLNQAALAAAVHYTRSTVANVEVGRQNAPEGFWARCDEVLGADGALRRGHQAICYARAVHHNRDSEVIPIPTNGGPGTEPAIDWDLLALVGRAAGQVLQFWNGSSATNRGPAAVLPGHRGDEREVLIMAAQRARAFALANAAATTSGEVVDQLQDDVHRLALAYPQRPLGEILGDLVDIQDSIFTLLEQRQRPAQARQLSFLGGVVSGILAKVSHDLGEPHTAMAQARTGYLCADNADHDGLRAWLRGLQSLISYWAGRTQESVRYAQAGTEFAARCRSSTAVWLPMNEARGLAALGDGAGARAAIERAEHAWDQVSADDLDDLGGVCAFTRPRQLYYAADALAWLPEEAEQAERYSTAAVDAYQDPTDPAWAFGDQAGSHADLAIARIARAELDGAADALAPVLDLPPAQRINGIIASMHRVHRALDHSRLSADASGLREQIEVFTRTPAAALPR